jgi:DNA-binding MurR/RpiR family transcriptional regulator
MFNTQENYILSRHILQVADNETSNNYFNTKYPLNALTNLLARNFAEQGGGRRHT